MRIIALVGNELRHIYFVRELCKYHEVAAIYSENRFDGAAYGSEYSVLQKHFALRSKTEERHFGLCDWPSKIVRHCVSRGHMNEKGLKESMLSYAPEAVVVFGCGLIGKDIIEEFPLIINAHQGLSPYYRGSGTNFWPFYNQEPEYVGVTIHYIDRSVDTGKIISHGRPDINVKDSLHDIGCKTVQVSVTIMNNVLTILEEKPIKGVPQWEQGREYKRRDFNETVLRKVHAYFENGLLKQYLERQRQRMSVVQLVTLAM